MKTDHNILEKVDHKTGYIVPDNYFDSLRSKILENLPDIQEQKTEKLSMWRKIQPYVYMAAMFAGIWCMMKMFHMMTTTDLSLDNPPESVVLAMANADHSEWYAPSDSSDIFILEDDICSQYSSIEDFKIDFDNSEM